jgi:hypothetical protein
VRGRGERAARIEFAAGGEGLGGFARPAELIEQRASEREGAVARESRAWPETTR